MKTTIEMAREAGLLTIGTADGSEAVYTWPKGITEEIERFASLVRADERVRMAEQLAQQEPFGYFKAEPFGWTDCAESVEGAVALYERPQPAQQEPVAWARNLTDPQPHCVTDLKYMSVADTDAGVQYTPLYTSPPAQRTWVGLTDEDIDYLCELAYENDEELILTVQAKLKEKNT